MLLQHNISAKTARCGIVVEDKETGKASINIPIKSRQHITDVLSLIGKLLAKQHHR